MPIPTPIPKQSYKWKVVGMLWLVCCFNYADRQAIFSVFPMLKQEFGFDPVQLGLIGSAFAWTYAFGSPLAGFIGDHLSRKKLILGGCIVWSALTGLTGSCSKFWQFLGLRAVVGGGETVYFPASLALMSDYHGPRTRSRALAIHQSGVYVGTILGSWLGAWLAVTVGWRAGFYVFGAFGILLALVLARTLREPRRGGDLRSSPGEPVEAPPSVREVLSIVIRKPTAWLLMLVFFGANFVATIFLAWTPTFLVEKFDFKLVAAGLTGVVYIHLASAVSSPIGGWMADRLAGKFSGGRVIVQAAGLLAGAGFVALVALTDKVATLLVGMTLFGFCKGLYDSNIWSAIYDVIEPRARSTAVGLGNTVGWAGGAVGPVFVGVVTKYGRHASQTANMSESIALGAVIYLVCGILLVGIAFGRVHKDMVKAPVPESA